MFLYFNLFVVQQVTEVWLLLSSPCFLSLSLLQLLSEVGHLVADAPQCLLAVRSDGGQQWCHFLPLPVLPLQLPAGKTSSTTLRCTFLFSCYVMWPLTSKPSAVSCRASVSSSSTVSSTESWGWTWRSFSSRRRPAESSWTTTPPSWLYVTSAQDKIFGRQKQTSSLLFMFVYFFPLQRSLNRKQSFSGDEGLYRTAIGESTASLNKWADPHLEPHLRHLIRFTCTENKMSSLFLGVTRDWNAPPPPAPPGRVSMVTTTPPS